MLAATPATALAAAPASAPGSHFVPACGAKITPAKLHCLVIRNTAARPTAQTVRPGAIPSGNGYGPASLQAAYDLAAASATDGSGTTVALVDAYDDPSAASDLAEYRSAAGLPALTSGQFTKYNQEGQASPLPAEAPVSDDWTLEETLDIDMVSAICPRCKIDLVEADNDSGDGLYVAEHAAATTLGAKYISNSWGGSETSADTGYDSEYFGVPGVVYTASAGDAAYGGGVIYPATSPNVVSVGGTTLNTSSNPRGWTESVWDTTSGEGPGSGCSAYEPRPAWQTAISIIPPACSKRVDNDVAADADPGTGAAVYDTSNGNGGWTEVGGTSQSSPIIAAVFALAGNDGNGGNNAADSIYTHTGNLYEVTGGSNGTCTPPAADSVLCSATGAVNTYNGPTGWGTPDGLTAFQSNSTTGGGCTAQQLLGNPGFESGSISPWTSTSGVLANISAGVPAQAGSWLAWLDGFGTAHTDTLAQPVTIPAGCQSATFSYWAEVNSTVTTAANQAQNTLVLEVLNSSGAVVQTVPVATAANNGTSYVEYRTNLAAYIGQTITLKFIGTEASGGNTSFFEDTNAVNVG